MKYSILFFIFVISCCTTYSQNLKTVTAQVSRGTSIGVQDIEPLPDENARVFSYGYSLQSRSAIALVKLDQYGNIVFNRSISISGQNVWCQKIVYAYNKLFTLLGVMDISNHTNWKTIVASFDKSNGNLLSAEMIDGYYSTQEHYPVDLMINQSSTDQSYSVLSYGYSTPTQGTGSIYNTKLFLTSKDLGTGSFAKTYEFSDPSKPTTLYIPSNIITNWYNLPDNVATYTRNSFSFCFTEYSGYYSNHRGFIVSGTQQVSVANPTVLNYSSTAGSYFVNNATPGNNGDIHFFNMGYWDGIYYMWGQVMDLSLGGNSSRGNFFYGRALSGSIKSYYNQYFLFTKGKKRFMSWESTAGPDNAFQFSGGYVNLFADVNTSPPSGYINGELGFNANPETMLNPVMYELNVAHNETTVAANIGFPSVTYSIGPQNTISSSIQTPGVAERISSTSTNKFYYWNDNDNVCSTPVNFVEQDLPVDERLEQFVSNVLDPTITPLSNIVVGTGPSLVFSRACSDIYDRRANLNTLDIITTVQEPLIRPNMPSPKTISENISKNESLKFQNSISVSPNPASTVTMIKSNNKIKSLDILDSKGSLIKSIANVNASLYSLNVAFLSKGIYLLKINISNGQVGVKKLIVQ